MELTYLLLALFAGLSSCALLVHGETEAGITEAAITDEQHQVHEECRNPDYKKYLKCLMRPKRHHHMHGDGLLESDSVHCLESCLKKCSLDHDCDKKCSHCTKRTKHRHQIVTEYEVSCESGNCHDSDGLKATNITTNIDINNIINATSIGRPCTCGTGPCACTDTTWTGGGGIFASLMPQISMVPQITYGLAGGCLFNQWLCIQQVGTQRTQPSDCSVCGNPLLHHKCNVTFCYAANVATSCKSSTCVGGST